MKILFLGPRSRELFDFLKDFGEEVISTEDKLSPDSPSLQNVDFLISYGYRHILGDEVLALFPRRAINLHISLLPWNRGADPNLWSFLENTPKGVTIHYMNHGLDTGDILTQKEVEFASTDTLRSSYERLRKNIEDLFKISWQDIRLGKIQARPQMQSGTYHRSKDSLPYQHLLVNGWDTPVDDVLGKAMSPRVKQQ